MSLCTDVKPQCRVDLPRISTPGHPGGECALVPGKIGDLQSKKYVTPYNVVYHRPGTTVRNWNHRGLKLPQKQDYLAPIFYDSGCSTFYGNSKLTQGPNSATSVSPGSQAMYDAMFQPMGDAHGPYFQGNHPYCNCGGCGGQCLSPNTSLGWAINKDGKLNWVAQAEKASKQ